jgi:hypothetical protein
VAFLWGLGALPAGSFIKASSANVVLLGDLYLSRIDPAAPGIAIGSDIIALGGASVSWADGGLKITGGQAVMPGLGLYPEDILNIIVSGLARQVAAVDGAYAMAGFTADNRGISRAGGIGRAAGVWARLTGEGAPASPLTISGGIGAGKQVAAHGSSYSTGVLQLTTVALRPNGAPQDGAAFFGFWRGPEAAGGDDWPGEESTTIDFDHVDREIIIGAYAGGAGLLDLVAESVSVHRGGV